MSEHAPSPWRFSRDEFGIKIYDKNGAKIAVVGGRYLYTGLEEIEWKNAQIIVAAPELLKAVKLFTEFFDEMPKGQLGKIVCDLGLLNEALLTASKAIADVEAAR